MSIKGSPYGGRYLIKDMLQGICMYLDGDVFTGSESSLNSEPGLPVLHVSV